MSRFHKLAQSIWYCQDHITWTPKYRYRMLHGKIGREVETSIRAFSEQLGCEIVELNVQMDHVHLLVLIPPKVSVSSYVGTIKGRSAIRVLNRYKELRQRPYWGNHFWAKGYCVDTVGLDSEMIRKYVKYQQDKEQAAEKRRQ